MSNCWKCGKPLPEGQVECEYGCAGGGELDAQTQELAKELKTGHIAAFALAMHLQKMGAANCRRMVQIGDEKYLVSVERIKS
ncbi:MAG TPA: hypothetical protein VK742_20300 [Candidatus Sulfotelmatobacter sp.]|jgi:hypothetical protein|nr:hypothetical protein [Candidatus Sulfotelmatobacter sp.]